MIFNIDKETMPREKIREIQLSRLQDLCRRVYANVPFYRRSFDEKGIKPSDVQSLDDLKFLPFTLKQDMRNNYPYGLFAVPMEMIQRIHASSGTTGKATVVGYTKRDIETWAECAARSLAAAGATANDIVQVSYGYGLFTGGLGAHYGAERLGATVIPMSGGSTKRQVQLMRDFGATVLCCTPSYALHLHDAGLEIGINIKDLPLRLGVFGAEPWTEEMRREIEDKLGITATNIYGLSEIMGPGVSQSCAKEQHGMHIWEDHFLPEIIDPVSGEILPEGSTGELVITTLTKQGIPLVRYRTRDITSLNYTPCSCGRTHVRMNRITGRSDDMLIIRGVNVFPSQIESLLLEVQGVSPHYQLILTRENNLDYVEVQVELDGAMFSDAIKDLQQREQRIQKGIKEFLGVTTKVRLVEPHSIPRSEGKAVRVIDRRVKYWVLINVGGGGGKTSSIKLPLPLPKPLPLLFKDFRLYRIPVPGCTVKESLPSYEGRFFFYGRSRGVQGASSPGPPSAVWPFREDAAMVHEITVRSVSCPRKIFPCRSGQPCRGRDLLRCCFS